MRAQVVGIGGAVLIGIIAIGIAYRAASRDFKEGWIYSKEFIPAKTQTIMRYNPALKMNFPQTIHHSESYRITITNEDYEDMETFRVNKRTYSEHSRGDWISFK